jgi:hypothetical protein
MVGDMASAPGTTTQGFLIRDYAKFHDNLLCFRRVQAIRQKKGKINSIDLLRFPRPQEKRRHWVNQSENRQGSQAGISPKTHSFEKYRFQIDLTRVFRG